MSSRDDSLLYTGMTSRLSREQAKAREVTSPKETEKAKLKPVGELVINAIKAEREAISAELGNIIHVEMKATDVKATILGLRLADQRMVVLSNKMKNILREREDEK